MQTTTTLQKTERVVSRVSSDHKEVLEQAAFIAGFSSVNQFIVQSALREAEQIIQQEHSIHLSVRDTHRFLELLENSPKPNNTLLNAAKTYRDLVESN
jgi:uncharacterized protein (DUF1778 family)